MKKFNEKTSRARSDAVRGSQDSAQQRAMQNGLRMFRRGQKVKRNKDGSIFTVKEHTNDGLRFDEVDGLFSPTFFSKVK